MGFAGLEGDRFLEHRSGIDARMKLAALAARIDCSRQVAQQRAVEFTAGEARVDLPSVDARKARPKASVHHLFGELVRRYSPHGKQRLEPRARKLLFAVATDILEKQIAKCRVRESVRAGIGDRGAHLRLIDIVRTRMWNVHDMQ